MKLTIIGGGGFRVPLIYKALIADRSAERVTELRLYDTDEARLGAIAQVLRELEDRAEEAPSVITTTDAATALAGTDFVFSAMRVGGTHGRAVDEQVALRHGVIGQETVGAGGISYALRCIPAVLDLVEEIRTHAPQAWVMNFTNPAGVVTEVMQRHLGDRVIGICDSPLGLARRALDALRRSGLIADDVPSPDSGSDRIHIGYAGLNHLGWISALHVDGTDVLPLLLDRPDLIETFEEGRLFGASLIRALGVLPNEYLHYYYFSREDLAIDLASDKTRGVFLEAQQAGFYGAARRAGDGAYDLWERTRREREETYMATNREAAGSFERDDADMETGGYDQVALSIMHAIANDEPATLILNVANRGALPELDDTAVVEIPCRVDGRGLQRLPGAVLPEHGRGLVVNAKVVERYTIAAATERWRQDAVLALMCHPLVDSYDVAVALLDELIDNFPELGYLRDTADA